MNPSEIRVPSSEEIKKRLILFDYIDGERTTPTVELDSFVYNPSTGEPIALQKATSPEQLERALQTAHRLHQTGVWANTPPEARAEILEHAANHLMTLVPEIAAVESYTNGVVISTTQFVNAIVWLAFKAAAGVLRQGYTISKVPGPYGDVEILRKPIGVAVAIVPWNSPAALAAHKVANALAAGCPVILKPSEWMPYSCLLLAEGLEAAGLPRGLFQIVNGGAEVGQRLVNDPRTRAVSFTGGLQGGRAVAAACAHDFKSVQLELGGNNAMIVLADADMEKTVDGIVAGLITLNGQWCRALGRLLIHETIYEPVLELTLQKLKALRVGDALHPETQLGPLANPVHKARVEAAVRELEAKGARIHVTASVPSHGFYFSPTLLTNANPQDTLDEIFGPVAAVHPFQTDEEAIELANQSPYGLGGYVFSADEEHAFRIARKLRTGGVKINGVSLLELNVDAPRPAWGLSGFGEEGTFETFDVFCGKSVVGVAAR